MRTLALATFLVSATALAGETTTVPKGVFVLDEGYLTSSLDKRWNNERQAIPLIDDIKRYEPGGSLQGTLTGKPTANYRFLVTQLFYGITDNLMLAVGMPVVLKTTVNTNLGWTPGDYQPQLGRAYSEDDFWAWAQSMGQGKPPATWEGNQNTLADMLVGARFRLPENDVLKPLGLDVAGTLMIALPTGHSPDPEELIAAGTSAWELHNFGDVEAHLAADRKFFFDGSVARLNVGFDVFYAYFRSRTYTTPTGAKYPLLMNFQPYVGDTYSVDPGDWVAGTFLIDLVPFIGPTRASFVSNNDLAKAQAFPPMVSLTLGYGYIHTAQTLWKSDSPKWDWDREQPWRPGDKNALKATLNLSLLRVGLPLQLYGAVRNQSIIPGKNTRPADTMTLGARAILKFW